MISVLDLFRIGIGPSSSHTVGPMRIAKRFLEHLDQLGRLVSVVRVEVEMQGSLALTGVGHGSPDAVLLGLMGLDPETVDPDAVAVQIDGVASGGKIALLGKHSIAFDQQRALGGLPRLAVDDRDAPDIGPADFLPCTEMTPPQAIAIDDHMNIIIAGQKLHPDPDQGIETHQQHAEGNEEDPMFGIQLTH